MSTERWYWVVDRKTGIAWANGAAFRDKIKAMNERDRLVRKYGNPDLRVVEKLL